MFFVSHHELHEHMDALRHEFRMQFDEYHSKNSEKFLGLAKSLVLQFNQTEKRIMAKVAVEQEQIDAVVAHLNALAMVVATVKSDNDALQALVTGLRKQLADALAANTPLEPADLTNIVASIDAVTGTLSDTDASDKLILNPPPPPVTDPIADAPAPPPPPNGTTAPVDGTPAEPAPNAGDPTGATGVDHSSPVPSSGDDGTTATDPNAATTGNGTDPGNAVPAGDQSQGMLDTAPGSASPGAGSTGAGTDMGSVDNSGTHSGTAGPIAAPTAAVKDSTGTHAADGSDTAGKDVI